MYKQKKCIGCLSCVDACPEGAITLTADGIRPVEGVKCLRYGRCASECPTLALEMCGREWSMEELMAEIEKERDIMTDSGGGVTLCGGEPLFQPEATIAVLDELGRRGFHRTVDTTLFADPEIVREVAKRCELLLVDMKIMLTYMMRQTLNIGGQ